MSERGAHADPIIVCEDVRKRFGAVGVLHGVDLVVGRGEFAAISGPSGGGKSTLLHLLAALDRPTSGRIVVDGHDLARLHSVNRYRREDIGIVFQFHNLLPHLSAACNVELAMFGGGLTHHQRSARAASLLGELGVSDVANRSPSRLSGGERQRVAIARALANSPRVLLADEPTGSLDPDATETVLDLLLGLRTSSGLTVVIVTHDDAVAERADWHVHLEHGRIVGEAERERASV